MKWWLIPALVLVVVAATPFNDARAQASTTVVGPRAYQEWVDSSAVPTPRGSVRVIDAECGFTTVPVAACRSGRVVYSVSRGGPALFFHELGHVFDSKEMDRVDREAFADAYDQPRRWNVGDFPLSERFAEAYQACALAQPACRGDVRAIIDRAWRVNPRKPKRKHERARAQRHRKAARR